jgi:predicted metal-dependent enzyme (double-stranded beta helix superfamily)
VATLLNLTRLPRFVQALTALHDSGGLKLDELARAARPLLQELVSHDDWLPDECAQPDPVHYRQYLLHADPADRFSVVSFVWGPGQATPVHDHTVWGLIGMLRGAERSQRFAAGGPGGSLVALDTEVLQPGQVDHVSPTVGDIHRVSNLHDDRVSISIHVYGGNIGRIERHVYDPATGHRKTFVSGYSNPAPSAA